MLNLRWMAVVGFLAVMTLVHREAKAQFDAKPQPAGGAKLDKSATQTWEVGVRVQAVGGDCLGLFGTIPIPTDWPEQSVKVVGEDITANTRNLKFRMIDGGVKQMVFEIPQLPGGEKASAILTLEITKNALAPPADTSGLVIPKDPPRDVRKYLGPSPLIESTNTKIKALGKELMADKSTAWEQVEAIYDGVRSKVNLGGTKQMGAAAALKEGSATKEDLTSLFVATCRSQKIPARIVWVTDSLYAEFYLEDAEEKGNWYPCQVAGAREFGGVTDTRPILQKGDNIRVPERKEPYRFVPEFFTGKKALGKPQVEFVRRLEPVQ
ncbi:transglutaminase domain protein [Pirellula staleyi DSM 6068]|uniref:Transglutaminase domain protein n=1 Tax=Pirellula staleyi (strain ATCC 27377 / DSM 6068 / ICPB 4128) TaxID=530564 RepID=D2QXM9_PIRSD|nr:transglutaminase family protein [Pirellula staleyi]ADB16214.1 transglutaminase domain protein [Pirellula staleyi DSM 6068]